MDNIEFPQNLVKNLVDKSIEKRKQASNDLERIISTLAEKGQEARIKQLINYFDSQFIQINNQNNKKGGLSAFGAIAIGLFKEEQLKIQLVDQLINPILSCFKDQDSKIRFSACEALYNTIKAFRGVSLIRLNDIFDQLLKSVTDQDEEIRKATLNIDRILKDVISESSNTEYFELTKFIPQIYDGLKLTHNFAKQLVITWLSHLDSIRSLDLISHLPSFLKELFYLLEDSNKDIRIAADNCLLDFLKEIKEYKKRTPEMDSEVINILVNICKGDGTNFLKLSALLWVHTYLELFISESNTGYPSVVDEEITTHIKQHNSIPIYSGLNYILESVLFCLSSHNEDIKKSAKKANELLIKLVERHKYSTLQFLGTMEILKNMFSDKNTSKVESALIWMKHFLQLHKNAVLPTMNDILDTLIQRLQDPEESLVLNVVEVLGYISQDEQFYDKIILKIFELFAENPEMLQSKGLLVIRKLCSIIDSKRVFQSFAQKIINSDNSNIRKLIVQTLDYILITEDEIKQLRLLINNLLFDDSQLQQSNLNFFESIYQACAKLKIDQEILIQVARLVQYIESPIFTYLRLQLIEPKNHPFLIKSLFGLLMILPQGKAFQTLKSRLKYINQRISTKNNCQNLLDNQLNRVIINKLDINKLASIYMKIQELE